VGISARRNGLSPQVQSFSDAAQPRRTTAGYNRRKYLPCYGLAAGRGAGRLTAAGGLFSSQTDRTAAEAIRRSRRAARGIQNTVVLMHRGWGERRWVTIAQATSQAEPDS
jgi:hypothetical protein